MENYHFPFLENPHDTSASEPSRMNKTNKPEILLASFIKST